MADRRSLVRRRLVRPCLIRPCLIRPCLTPARAYDQIRVRLLGLW